MVNDELIYSGVTDNTIRFKINLESNKFNSIKLFLSYDQVESKWILKSKKYPDFMAISNSLPSSLGLGINTWIIKNDSKVIVA